MLIASFSSIGSVDVKVKEGCHAAPVIIVFDLIEGHFNLSSILSTRSCKSRILNTASRVDNAISNIPILEIISISPAR